MKIYLIGYLYDDESYDGDFDIKCIASTFEKAKAMLRQLLFVNSYRTKLNIKEYQIREWDVDKIEPIGEVFTHQCQFGNEYFDIDRYTPYKIIYSAKGEVD